MTKRKCECEEFDDVSMVLPSPPNAKIHAVVTSVANKKS